MCGPGQDSHNFWLSKPFGLDIADLDRSTRKFFITQTLHRF